MDISPIAREYARDLLRFIDRSPSPWHVAYTLEETLCKHGYTRLEESQVWNVSPGSCYYTVRGESSLIAFRTGLSSPIDYGFRLVGAHTDSPGLRLTPKSPHAAGNYVRLGVHIYGGPILATFTDRDLSLAGRVCIRRKGTIATRLVCFEEPLVRLPNLAIHMNRGVNDSGLKLDTQRELPLLFSELEENIPPKKYFLQLLAHRVEVRPEDIVSFELAVIDTQPGTCWGPQAEYIANSQIDNLSSCYAGLTALINTQAGPATSVVAFFDHEEVGSESYKGAAGSFLHDVLERIVSYHSTSSSDYKRALSRSFLISADAAHAHHPNFPSAYEPWHPIQVNSGVAIKTNAQQRYTTDSLSEAYFIHLCEQANVPYQQYVHHAGLPCGSTIGPVTAAKLGIPAVDVGCPMWAMHSLRESAGVCDQIGLSDVLALFFECEHLPL